MAEKNSTILDALLLEGTNDYQQNIPSATQRGVSETVNTLFHPMNGRYYNEFVNRLVNRIGMVIAHQRSWTNPLKQFKRGMMENGSTIEEIGTKFVKAHSYSDEKNNVFKTHRPDSVVAYHTINYEQVYPITVNRVELRRAFTSSETGLSDYIASVMAKPINTDEYNEYRTMVQLFREFAQNDGFFQIHVPTVNRPGASSDDVKSFLETVRAVNGRMKFPSASYNKAGLPMFATDLCIFVTPETAASIDVNVLAGAFNVSYTEMQNRVIMIDDFADTSTQAIITDRDFFMCADTFYGMESFHNPLSLNDNFYLHHQGVFSVSPFMPAVILTNESASAPITVTETFTGVGALYRFQDKDAADWDIPWNNGPNIPVWNYDKKRLQLAAKAVGTLDPVDAGDVAVKPESVKFVTISATSDGTTPVKLNSRTYVDRDGFVHLQKDLRQTGATLLIQGYSTYGNPSDRAEQKTGAYCQYTLGVNNTA